MYINEHKNIKYFQSHTPPLTKKTTNELKECSLFVLRKVLYMIHGKN